MRTPLAVALTGLLAPVLVSRLAAAGDFDRTTIFQAPNGQSAMYAQLTPLRDGQLLCAFRLAWKDGSSPWTVPGSRIVCIRSGDGGRTWSKDPLLIFQDKDSSAYTSQCGLGYQAADGTILVPFYVVTMTGEGRPEHIHWNMLGASRDGGQTWYCRNLPSQPFLTNPTFGGLCRTGAGALWMLERCRGYGLDLPDVYLGKKSWLDVRSCVRIVQSRDEGQSWEPLCYVGYDPAQAEATAHFPEEFKEDEPALTRLPSGRILLVARPYLYQAASDDAGKNWQIGPSLLTRPASQGKRVFTGLSPVLWHSPAGPKGGTTLLAYHDRWEEHAQQGGIYMTFSHDEGRTWGRPTWIAPGAYPCLYESPAGRMCCAYYASNARLEAAFFAIPFPTGVQAESTSGDQPAVLVSWDPYSGPDADSYEYQVYRGPAPGAIDQLLGVVRADHRFRDTRIAPRETYHYQVIARADKREVGRSWTATARPKTAVSAQSQPAGPVQRD